MTRLAFLARCGLVVLAPALLHCSNDDRTRGDAGPIADGSALDARTPDGGSADGSTGDGWSLDISPQADTYEISMERHGAGFLVVERASTPVAFHKVSDSGTLQWSWSPENGDVRHYRHADSGDLVLSLSLDLSGSQGNVILFKSVSGADGSESWSTRHDFTLGWCRGVCAVEANNREYISGFVVSEDTIFYSGRYTADPRHLFGQLDLATGTNDPTETSDRANYYRALLDLPGPGFVGIYQAGTARERRILSPTWAVDATSPTAREDEHVEHPTGLVSYLAAAGQLELIDETGAVQSMVSWTPPGADFEYLSAIGDSLVLSFDDAGMTGLAAASISSGAEAWRTSFSNGATFDIADSSIAIADPTSDGFVTWWLSRSDGTETARHEEVADICELGASPVVSVSVVQLAEQTVVAHCALAGDTRVIRVRPLAL